MNAENKLLESKLKELKKNHSNVVASLKNDIKSIEKSNKSIGKENHDQKRNVESARETIKNIKAQISHANMCRTKLESENRKLRKKLDKKESCHVNRKEKAFAVDDICPSVLPNNLLDPSSPSPPPSTSTSGFSSIPSMVSHWNPIYNETPPQTPSSIPSLVSHCVNVPSPVEENLKDDANREDFKEWFEEFREQLRADRTRFMAELRKDFSMFNLS